MRLCIIPARGGSKRIPRKNIKEFHGHPIIAYSINAAIASQCFDKIIVSTDDQEIADISIKYGAEVPYLREAELSNDSIHVLPVLKDGIEFFENKREFPKEVCCIFATAPFIRPDDIAKAYQQLRNLNLGYCFSATSFSSPIQRAFKINKGHRIKMFYPEFFNQHSQDLEESFHDAGQFYWGKVDFFKQQRPIISEAASAFLLPRYLVQDIDTQEDWKRAEIMYKVLQED